MQTVLIIGAGQLGSRHLQGVVKHTTALKIYVIDPSEASLDVAKERANEVEHIHTILFSTTLDASTENIDVAIVATNAKVREKVVKQLIEKINVRYLILEKILFPDLAAYTTIRDLIERKKVKTWVNHSRRMYPLYKNVKSELDNNQQNKIHITVTGNNWGLGCNSLHYIDLMCFLNNTNVKEVDTNLLDKAVHNSKREGYIEFTGTLRVKFNCGSTLILTSFEGETLPANTVIQSNSFKWLIQEGGKAEVDLYKSGQPVRTEKITPLFQSSLSATLVADLLNSGKCDLPIYEEAHHQHTSFIKALILFNQKVTKETITHLNIT